MERGRDGPRLGRGTGQHLERGQQKRRLTRAVDQRARQFDPRDFAVRTQELDLVALGGGLAREPPGEIVLHQLRVFRGDEIGQGLADHLGGAHPEHRKETRVGEQDALAVHQHGVVHRLHQPLEQLLAIVESGAALLEGLEQLIDRAAQLSQRVRLPLETDAARSALFARELLDLAGEVVDGALLAALPGQQDDDACG